MSTSTIKRTSVEGFEAALVRRFKNNRPDAECAVIAEELLEEIRQLPENQRDHNYSTVRVANRAISFLCGDFWQNERKTCSFPKTRGVFLAAVVDGLDCSYNSFGPFPDMFQHRACRLILQEFPHWEAKEKERALTVLREKLQRMNPPVAWKVVCNILVVSTPHDCKEVIELIGRSFGHLAGQGNLVIAVAAIMESDPCFENGPPPR